MSFTFFLSISFYLSQGLTPVHRCVSRWRVCCHSESQSVFWSLSVPSRLLPRSAECPVVRTNFRIVAGNSTTVKCLFTHYTLVPYSLGATASPLWTHTGTLGRKLRQQSHFLVPPTIAITAWGNRGRRAPGFCVILGVCSITVQLAVGTRHTPGVVAQLIDTVEGERGVWLPFVLGE